jgi:hypothetical protein
MNLTSLTDEIYYIWNEQVEKKKKQYLGETLELIEAEWSRIGAEIKEIQDMGKRTEQMYREYDRMRQQYGKRMNELQRMLTNAFNQRFYVDTHNIYQIDLEYIKSSAVKHFSHPEVSKFSSSLDPLKREILANAKEMKTDFMLYKYLQAIFGLHGISGDQVEKLFNELQNN